MTSKKQDGSQGRDFRNSDPQKSSQHFGDHKSNDHQNTEKQSSGFEIEIEYSISPSEDSQPRAISQRSDQPNDQPNNQPNDQRSDQPNNQPNSQPKAASSQSLSEPPLYFLSVNYYSAALLSDLMHTLDANQGIVIVNNSPSDRVIHGLAEQTYAGGEVTVIDAPNNNGFGSGCNLGLQWIYARSPNALVWIINPDTCLLPNAASVVRRCFRQQVQHRNIAILGTPILSLNGRMWFNSGQFNRWTGSVRSLTRLPASRKPASKKPASKKSVSKNLDSNRSAPTPTRWVSGCSMVLNLGELDHCPQFDDTYFLYYEDCDLCERYFQQGHMIAIAPEPLVVHAVSSITSRHPNSKHVHATFSKLTFLRRHATPPALWLNIFYLFAQSVLLRLVNPAAAQGRRVGLRHFFKGIPTRPSAAARSSTATPAS